MAMQSHRGGSAVVVQSTFVPTTTMDRPVPVQSGVGTSQQRDSPVADMPEERRRDIPVADMPDDEYVCGTQDLRARDFPVAGMPENPNYSSRPRNTGEIRGGSSKVQLVPQSSAGGTARVLDQRRGTHVGTTSVVEIHYQTPSGSTNCPLRSRHHDQNR